MEISDVASLQRRRSRRRILAWLAAGTACTGIGAVAGVAMGYKYRHPLHDLWRATMADGRLDTPGVEAFAVRNSQLRQRRARQTPGDVQALREKYAAPIIGKVAMWDLVLMLARCQDWSDSQLFEVSQFVHVKQLLAAMEREDVSDPALFLAALLHDVGKVALLSGAPGEDILGGAWRLTDGEPGAGLDQLTFQYGHAELIYSRIKDFVPDHVAWMVRYHNIYFEDTEKYMTVTERSWFDQYLRPFRRFDAGFKSVYYVPDIKMDRYRALIEQHFPKPIVF